MLNNTRVVLVFLLTSMALINTGGAGVLAGGIFGGSSTQHSRPDYQFRTSRAAEPSEEKRIWDYFSFFAIRRESDPGHQFPAAEAEELRSRTRELAQQLIVNGQEDVVDGYVLTVNSFVNLNNLYKTSSLGRYLGEQMIGEFQAAGIEVIDVRKAKGLMVHEYLGEYGLSRDMNELSSELGSQAMVVGTYSYANGQILINARVLRNRDGMVLSHANLTFALDELTLRMLKDESAPARRGGLVSVEAVN
ncbi:MAG: hypothetical protein KKD63_11860 [Proteobacteria bacterium]|nr:hypothetical protein [Desulfobulbaceae bacterium]MBU4153568.1 hypothetical protein [Pseudomonadota bacterium]MDP2104919.1 FlgO family outer membrane protein [Desulfobulbaceae bacterium]